MPIKEQIYRVNWIQFVLNSLTVSTLVCGGLVGAAKVWGDTLWVNEEQAATIAVQAASKAVIEHEASPTYHPSVQRVSDRLDERYILRREMVLIMDQLSRIESKLSNRNQ